MIFAHLYECTGRAVALLLALALVYVIVFYVMDEALKGELSCMRTKFIPFQMVYTDFGNYDLGLQCLPSHCKEILR